MIQHGWCPVRVRNNLSRFRFGVVFYLASIQQNSTRKANHETCIAEGVCFGDSIDPNLPVRCKNTMSGTCTGHCPSMPVPKQKVIDIIKDGGIPLITAHRNSTGQIKLDITKANRKVKYTAITHVWADGLGEYPKSPKSSPN